MALDHDLIRDIRDLDEYDLRRLMIFVRGLLVTRRNDDFDVDESDPRRGKVTYRQEMVRCGRDTCTRCPHGPYWYAYWREGGRMRSRYIGKNLPEGARSDP
jgi:hypothetical protein